MSPWGQGGDITVVLSALHLNSHKSIFHPPHQHHNNLAVMGSIVLPHLHTGWHVDQAILSEEERLVVIRFGRDKDCMAQDEVLYRT